MGSLTGLTQKALDSVVEWGQEFTLAMNGAKTVDMVISARRDYNIPYPPLLLSQDMQLVEFPPLNCLEFKYPLTCHGIPTLST